MIRTSTRNVWTPPSRSNSRSCSTRSSFGCSSSGNSPISSRNSVPLSASSMRPTFWLTAPVNAPFSCPKSSLSNNPAGTAAQLSLINVLSRRELSACTERATSSFPVPVSPNSKTVESVGANHPHVFQHFEQRRTLPNDFFKPKLRLNFTFQIRLFLRQLVPGVLQPIGHLPKLRDVRGSACNSNNLSGFIEQRLNRDIERVAPAVVRDRHFLSHCYPCFKNPPFEFSQACGLLRPENFCIRFADCLVLPIELRVVNPGVAQLAVLIENRNGRILESHPKPFFVPAHRFLRLPALADRLHNRLRPSIRQLFSATLSRDHRSVLTPEFPLAQGYGASCKASHFGRYSRTLLSLNNVRNGKLQHLLSRIPQHFGASRVHVDVFPLRVGNENPVRRLFHQKPEMRFARLQRLFSPLALGDVDRCGLHQQSAVVTLSEYRCIE